MKLHTTSDILELMNGAVYAAVLGTAMELGLFWLLAEKPLPSQEIARRLDLPFNPCHYWLQILSRLGLLDETSAGYAPSSLAREAILEVQDQETWAFQAREDRDLSLYVRDLARNISQPISDWPPKHACPADDLQQLDADPTYPRRFTRKLFQIHRSLADQLAEMLNLRQVSRLLDLGGGSGVISFALLRKWPQLTCEVVDRESVCQAGREIAVENGLEQRIAYLAADILKDDLPTGFDLALLCDVGAFDQGLFRRVHAVLNPEGRLGIVDKFSPDGAKPPPSRLLAAFIASLEAPSQSVEYITVDEVLRRLQQSGFRGISTSPVPHADELPWNLDWTLIEAQK
jgi:ubiquinone/menaquinone biosynthesis C-methylase UbiE